MSEVKFDQSTTLWVSENDDVLHVATPTDAELEEQEWAEFVCVNEANRHISDLSLELRKAKVEIEELRKAVEKYAYRWSHNGDEFRQIMKDLNSAFEAKKAEVK